MSRLSLGVAVVGTLLLTACGEGTGPGDSNTRVDSLTALPRALSAVEQEGVQANNGFALSLLRTTVTRISGDSGNANNVLLSPISVSFALGLTMNGAANTTLAEMQQTLGWGAGAARRSTPPTRISRRCYPVWTVRPPYGSPTACGC